MRWQDEYRRKYVSAAEAVGLVRPSQRVAIPIGSNPLALGEALAARLDELPGLEMLHCAALAEFPWLHPALADRVKVVHEHWASPPMREAMRLRVHDYVPMPFSRRFRGEEIEIPPTTTRLTVEQFSAYLAAIIGHWAKRGVYVEMPEAA